ncbi:hypothetical protein CONCODRAFT_3424 [Conidiobolus coronatus NRRL 28638]|uniref:Uncharacterized protein n=1 Tax=Conidiobolus coronatus (strain ATCC 28846 / CBS 209.66 / NRRL 28638) TaxID=796925 RepID=A0A137PF51_CONC2|nr:hypothetical protein CONCODRAFT_3424 [Conidiobolus coronatus NRRL 28638]|eukprot:KXN73607.1 hypothetical protein CONCODRAFT_3424 [Conidiobolus coronatus NRRL 28638]
MEFPYRKATKFSARSLGNLSDNLRKKLKLDNANNFNVDTFKPLHIPSIPIPRRKPSTNLNPQANSNLEQSSTLDNVQNANLLNSNINTSTSPGHTQSTQPFSIPSTSVADASLPQAWQGIGLSNLTTAQQTQNSNYLQAISPNPRQSAEEQISPGKAQNVPTIKDFLEEDTQSSIDFPNDLPPWPEQDSSMSFDLPQLHGDIDSSVDMDQSNKRETDFGQIQLDRDNTRDEDSILSVDFEKPSQLPQDSSKADNNQMDFDISLDNINPDLEDSSAQTSLQRDYSDRRNLEKSKGNQANSSELEKALPEFEYSFPAEAEDNENTHENTLLSEDIKTNELSQLSEITTSKDSQNKTEVMLQNAENSKNNQQQSLNSNADNQTEAVAKPTFGSAFSSFTSAGAPNQSTENASQASTAANLTFWHGVALSSVTSRLNPVKFQPPKPADFLKKPLSSKEQSEQSGDTAKSSSPVKQSSNQLNSSVSQINQAKEELSQVESSIKKQAIADQSFTSNNSEQLGLDKAALTVDDQKNNQVDDAIEDTDGHTAPNLESQYEYNVIGSKVEEPAAPIPETAVSNPEHPEIENSTISNTASGVKSQPEQVPSENSSTTAQPSTLWHGFNLSAVSKGPAQPTSQPSAETSTLTHSSDLNDNATLWHGISLSSVTSRGSNPFSSTQKLGAFSNSLTSVDNSGSKSQDKTLSVNSSIGKSAISDNAITDGQDNNNTEDPESLSQSKKRLRNEEEDNVNQPQSEALSDNGHSNKSSRIIEPENENTAPAFQTSEEHADSLPSNKRSREEDEDQDDSMADGNQHIEKSQEEELANFSPLQSEPSISSIQPPVQPLPTSLGQL